MKKYLFVFIISLINNIVFSQDCFKIGSSKALVKKIQGTPTAINNTMEEKLYETWNFNFSTVTFKNGFVYEYNNFGDLKLCSDSIKESTVNNADNSHATKNETENWIIAKLSAYKDEKISCSNAEITSNFSSSVCTTRKNYKFEFQDGYLIITCLVSSSGLSHNDNYNEEIKIPVYDIKGFYGVGYGLSIFTNSQTIQIKKLIDGSTVVYDTVNIGFRCDRETDLAMRIDKAVKHLQRFYSKPINNEPF